MKAIFYAFFLGLGLCGSALAINFDSLPARQWARIPLAGTNFTGAPFNYTVDIHLSEDTSGNLYYFGACAYGGASGGTHNNDAFRFNVKTGGTEQLYKCGTNPWAGGCQAGQCYDAKRNCIWFSAGANATCVTNVQWYSGQPYYGGLYRYQCPNGPITKVRDNGFGVHYWRYDPVDDVVLAVGVNGYGYRACVNVYDIGRDSIYQVLAPRGTYYTDFQVPTCYDSKRNLVAITMWRSMDASGGYAGPLTEVWFYHPGTKTWSYKTPSSYPGFENGELAYDAVNDKYAYFGGHTDPGFWFYDYDTNQWTEIQKSSSTLWPMHKYKAGWDYVPKYNVLVSMGGAGDGYQPAPSEQPQGLWVYRLGGGNTTVVEKSSVAGRPGMISVCPNPYMGKGKISVNISRPSDPDARIRLLDLRGRLISDTPAKANQPWEEARLAPGLYVVQMIESGQMIQSRRFTVLK